MAVSAEILRQVQEARRSKDRVAEVRWQAKYEEIEALTRSGFIKQLPIEIHIEAPLSSTPERFQLRERFNTREKHALKEKGAAFYTLEGTTILSQKEARKKAGKPSFWYLVEAGDRVLSAPSLKVEVAIFPKPEEFFVPDSFGKDTDTQVKMAHEDARRLGLRGVTQIVADQASTLTELVFKHEEETGNWLFGAEYAKAVGRELVYGRTNNLTNENGSDVADVGRAKPGGGVSVNGWNRADGYDDVGCPRLVVAVKRAR